MGAILSLWDQDDSDWDRLPSHIRRQIYRETNADRELAVERLANAPGGWRHWLRNMAIGPELVQQVYNVPNNVHIPEQGMSLVLRDIVQKIARYERPGGNPNSDYSRPPILPVEVYHDFGPRNYEVARNPFGIIAMRIRVRFFVDFNEMDRRRDIPTGRLGGNTWSPMLEGRWFSAAELGI